MVKNISVNLYFYSLEREEDAARAVRKDQNTFNMEDVKKDFARIQEQSNYLEEKIVTLQKLTDSNGIESKNKCKFSPTSKCKLSTIYLIEVGIVNQC